MCSVEPGAGAMSQEFQSIYHQSLADPDGYWEELASNICWTKPWDRVLDDSRAPFYRWFSGGETNTCWNAIDRHVDNGRGDQLALIWESPITGARRTLTYSELKRDVATFAGVLSNHSVTRGDRVVIYMPAVPEAVIAMLACARIGAVHSVVFGGFAAAEVAKRLDDATPKVVLTATCGVEPGRIIPYLPILEEAFTLASHVPGTMIVLAREQQSGQLKKGRDHDWYEEMARATPVDWVPVAATDPLYILYTSGTTGKPKGVVRDNGGHAVALTWTMKAVYDVAPGECWWAASDIGWVVGHSYIVYAPLLHGNPTILFEGKPVGTPDAGVFWRVIESNGVAALFTAPTAIRAVRRDDPEGDFLAATDLSQFRTLFLAGERADPDTIAWAEEKLSRPVVDHWWQTETGWAMAAYCRGIDDLPVRHGSPGRPTPGYAIDILDARGHRLPSGTTGAVCVRLPLPPSSLPTLWNNDEGYVSSYLEEYPGYYSTGDAGMYDNDGYLYIMGRTDDVMNVAGHRLSTGAMEEVLATLPDVAECAVIGVADALRGQVPVGLLVLKATSTASHADIVDDAVRRMRNDVGAVANFRKAVIVPRLPKTRSGKILRRSMRQIADGDAVPMPATIEDPAALDDIRDALATIGYPAGD